MTLEFFALVEENAYLLDVETCCLVFRELATVLRGATRFVVVFVVSLTPVLALLAGSCVSFGAFLFFDCSFSCFGPIPMLSFHF